MADKFDISLGDGTFASKKREETHKEKRPTSTWYYLGLVGQIGYMIAIPLAGGAILGSYLDGKWATYPKATLAGIGVGCIVSAVGFFHVISDVMAAKKT